MSSWSPGLPGLRILYSLDLFRTPRPLIFVVSGALRDVYHPAQASCSLRLKTKKRWERAFVLIVRLLLIQPPPRKQSATNATKPDPTIEYFHQIDSAMSGNLSGKQEPTTAEEAFTDETDDGVQRPRICPVSSWFARRDVDRDSQKANLPSCFRENSLALYHTFEWTEPESS